MHVSTNSVTCRSGAFSIVLLHCEHVCWLCSSGCHLLLYLNLHSHHNQALKKKKNIVWIKYVVRSFAQTVIIILGTIQLQVVSSKSGVSWAGSCALTTLAASLQPHQRQFFFLKSNTLQLALQLMLNQLRSIFFHLINNGSNERTYVMELVCSDEPTENSAAL